MGRNESTVELLVKVWEGIREFLEVPNESTGSFFRHMRVGLPNAPERATRHVVRHDFTGMHDLSGNLN